jgi:hypothetical protein
MMLVGPDCTGQRPSASLVQLVLLGSNVCCQQLGRTLDEVD